MPRSRGHAPTAPPGSVRRRLPLLLGVAAAMLALIVASVLAARPGGVDGGVAARAPGVAPGEAEELTGEEGGAPRGDGPGSAAAAEDGGAPPGGDSSSDPPLPAGWEADVVLDDPISQGITAVEERPEAGVDAYRAALRAAVPATRDVPDALLDDYPETICVVAAQEPGAVPEVIDALRASGQIDPDVASFLTAAAVAAVCPEHRDALPDRPSAVSEASERPRP